MTNYSDIFNRYTNNNFRFYLLSRSVIFPDDKTLDIYRRHFVTEDTAWTVLSYEIYGTIDYWWVLCAINKADDEVFYAPSGQYVYYIREDALPNLLNQIS